MIYYITLKNPETQILTFLHLNINELVLNQEKDKFKLLRGYGISLYKTYIKSSKNCTITKKLISLNSFDMQTQKRQELHKYQNIIIE